MNLYLDEDSVAALLIRLLRNAGHDVEIPADAGLAGRNDAVHLRYAIHVRRACLTHNHKDFKELHDLMQEGTGQHTGILVVRKDNNPKRDLDARGILRALTKLLASGLPMHNHYQVLNHWR